MPSIAACFIPGWSPAADQNERAAIYTRYVESVLKNPSLVGCHWFQYVDEPLTGRAYDGENYNIGFLSVTDTPYPELVAAARAIHRRAYQERSTRPVSKFSETGNSPTREVDMAVPCRHVHPVLRSRTEERRNGKITRHLPPTGTPGDPSCPRHDSTPAPPAHLDIHFLARASFHDRDSSPGQRDDIRTGRGRDDVALCRHLHPW